MKAVLPCLTSKPSTHTSSLRDDSLVPVFALGIRIVFFVRSVGRRLNPTDLAECIEDLAPEYFLTSPRLERAFLKQFGVDNTRVFTHCDRLACVNIR